MKPALRKRSIPTWLVVGVATALLAPLSAAAATIPAADDDLGMELRLNQLASPGYGHDGHDMPVYLGYSNNTTFEGTEEAQRLEEPLVSNTVAVPRSEWFPGEGAGEFMKALGIIAGPIVPRFSDEFADSYYFWSGMPEGASFSDGDDIGHLKVWSGSIDAYQVPHTPTGRDGSFVWRHDPSWPNVLRSTTTSRARATLPDGEVVASPAAVSFTRAMYVNHVQLEVEDGDLDAADGDVAAPTFEFTQEPPPGTVMNLQSVGYSSGSGPWSDFLDVSPDFATGIVTGPTGEWRLPVDVTLEEGGFWPERSQPPGVAAPQYALALRAIGIPLLPEEAGPGANDIYLVSDIAPGETYVEWLALRQPDGSMETTRLVLDEPGLHVWRVVDGKLVEVESPARPWDGGRPAPVDENRAVHGIGAVHLSDGPGYEAAHVSADVDETPAALEEGETTADGFTIAVNDAGRPVAGGFASDGVRLVDLLDLPRVHTPDGPVELGDANRDGRVVVWEKPLGNLGRGRAAYRVGDLFVLVEVFATPTSLQGAVLTHSLSGEPIPHEVEAVASLGDATPVDLLTGDVTRATRFLPSELRPRLLLPTPSQPFRLEPLSWDGAQVELRNAGTPPAGEPLSEPEYVARITRPAVWGSASTPLAMSAESTAGPATAGFTAVRTYRMAPLIIDKPVPVGGQPLEETRDFDGYEQIGVAFRAERPDGTPIRRSDVSRLFLSLVTLDGRVLLSRSLTGASFTPDDGTTWGVVLTPNGDLDPADVVIYARATYDGGVVATEASPDVPAEDWQFRIDRIPVTVTAAEDGVVTGVTEPHAEVTVAVREAGVTAAATADAGGAFTATLDLSAVPGGDYEAAVRAVAPAPGEGKDLISALSRPSPANGAVPEDDTGTTTARLRHTPGGEDASLHRPGPPADTEAAAAFLATRQVGGAYDDSLRATAWAVAALGAPQTAASVPYLESLAEGGGYAWRAGEEPTAAATGLAAQALAAIGGDAAIDPAALLRWDGSADAAPGADASSVEATALLVVALDATGALDGFDPWWRQKIARFLTAATAESPAETYALAEALAALGVPADVAIPGDDVDAVAYRALTGAGAADDVAAYQLLSGGFTLPIDGDLPEALPTALALAALR